MGELQGRLQQYVQGWLRPTAAALLSLAVVIGLATTAGAASPPSAAGGGASGSVAAITGTSMEVQNASTGQTTVNWTGSTAFSQTVAETQSAVAAGDCLNVTGTASKTSKTTIAAKTISISPASSTGSCPAGLSGRAASSRSGFPGGGPRPGGGGFGGGFRGGFSGGEGGSNSGPGGFPGGNAGGHRTFPGANLSFANGKVTSVGGSTVIMTGTLLAPFNPPSKSTRSTRGKSTPKPTVAKSQSLTVTLSKATTLTQTQSTTAASLAVGDCVSAFGQTASTGAVTATTVRITSTGGKTCTTGFAGFGGGFGGGPGAGGPSGG